MNEHDLRILEDFCDRWLDKASTYDLGTLAGIFDHFFSIFVVYNHMYDVAAHRLLQRGDIKENDATDRKSATSHAVHYIGANRLADRLRAPENSENVMRIYELIDNGTFWVHSNRKNNQPDYARDRECLQNIMAGADEEYCTAILDLIYTTRCNMFHGIKQYHQIQKLGLHPMAAILRSVIVELRFAIARDLNT